jgi:FkbM family methyltransferase
MLRKNEAVATVHGVRLALDETRMSATMLEVIRAGNYEREEAHHIPAIVEPGERVVELGGGIGLISALVGRSGRAERVVVYEANPHLVPLLERTHALNGVDAEVVNAVVLPRPVAPTVPFYLRRDFWASSLSPEPYGYDEVVEVPVVGFEEMLERHRPTLLVVDIEGGEAELFRDVALTGVKKVYIEVHQQVLGRIGMKRLFDAFSRRDFHYDQWHSTHGVILFSHVLR